MKMNRKGKSTFAKTALVCMLAVCMFTCGAFVDGEVFAASEFQTSSPFNNVDYSSYYHNGRFTGNLIVNGVDISEWQSKNCDFAKAKNAGVDYAILRVTGTYYGRKNLSCYIDDNFATQYSKAKANGVMTGVYVFSQAVNAEDGAREAEFAVSRLRKLGIGPDDLMLPVYMDYEFYNKGGSRLMGLTEEDAIAAAKSFCKTVRSYEFAPDVDLWVAQYYKRNQSPVSYTKWQYSSSAKIDGMLSFTGAQGKIDVNFWYLNKNNETSTVVNKITGKTTLSVADAKSPKFKLYNGSKLMKEGTDYCVGGIRNNKAGNGYAYIKGIGMYSGYALIPIKIANASSGSDDQEITCANYLTKASSTTSKYINANPDNGLVIKVGNNYYLTKTLNVRTGPGLNYPNVKRKNLTKDAKKHATMSSDARLKKGTEVTCLEVRGSWMRIPSGWICCKPGNVVQ